MSFPDRLLRLGRLASPIVPRPVRVRASRLLGELSSARATRHLAALAESPRPLVVGPWFGEVGFELLYWAPFLSWFVSRFEVDPERVVAVSRGGVASWYAHVARRYQDVFDYLAPDEFRTKNERRARERGEQKQIVASPLDAEVMAGVTRLLGVREVDVLHPSMMYALFRPFWWGHTGVEWIRRHTRYRTLERPVTGAPATPRDYVAVKFYFNDCFPPTNDNRAFVSRVLRELAREAPVVSLATGLRIDDHGAFDQREHAGIHTIDHAVQPRNNLDVQSAIVAGARRFVGTYGGFAYLAPFYGVPSISFYSDPAGFSRRHLEVAQDAFARFGRGRLLELRDSGRAEPVELAAASPARGPA